MPVVTPKILAAALLAGMLGLGMAQAFAAEAATPNDTARFLAGLPPTQDSALAELTKDTLWQRHARRFDAIFQHEEDTSLSKIRAFAQARLTDTHATLLYMFSGPDFLYATSFFPNASTYVLSGLEPVGQVPQLTDLKRWTVEASLRNLEGSLNTLVNFSFFKTHDMKTELSTGPVYGTLPVLYVFLARTGKTIKEVGFISPDSEGSLQTSDEASARTTAKSAARKAPQNATRGVKIVFSDGEHAEQTLYYFSTDLSDDGVKRSGFLSFCDKLGMADSFIKSASYLLHGRNFTQVRNFLLDHSTTILEDDSGIPLTYFDPHKWRLQPFGRYLGPIAIFPYTYEAQLGELYRKGTAIPIEFGVGYRWRHNESNLLLAERAAPGASDAELTPRSPLQDQEGIDAQSSDKAKEAAGSVHPRRKHAEHVSKGCRIFGIFPFCSAPR